MEEDNTEQLLIERVRSHEPAAMSEYLMYKRLPLLAFIERRLGGALKRKLEPEDIFQEVSAEAMRSLESLDFSQKEPFSWLCQLAERRIIDAHRRLISSQKRAAGREVGIHGDAESSRAGLVNLLIASMTTASQAVSRDEKQLRLLNAMAHLPEDQQTALRLRYVDGLPSKDIAERLGKSDGSVRVMLTRSLAKLQQLLGVNPEEDN
ncbi:MAG: sigma-70 family RNA polymerase sigma factor [Pirellulales bacterium]|nr:sigma-70 family RNA polymerase sigma factor [Pirellulales bacterium]